MTLNGIVDSSIQNYCLTMNYFHAKGLYYFHNY